MESEKQEVIFENEITSQFVQLDKFIALGIQEHGKKIPEDRLVDLLGHALAAIVSGASHSIGIIIAATTIPHNKSKEETQDFINAVLELVRLGVQKTYKETLVIRELEKQKN